jgi:hypothetical protein
MIGKFYTFQVDMIGDGVLKPMASAEIYKYRPMPCTPAGDYIGEVETAKKAELLVALFNTKNFSVGQARRYISHAQKN